MLTVERDGFQYKMFPINAVPSRNSHFERLIGELEIGEEVMVINPVGRFYFELPEGEIRTMEMP